MYPQDDTQLKLVYNLSMFLASIITGLLVTPLLGFAVAAAWVAFWHYGLYWVPQNYPELTEEEEAAVAMRRYFDGHREKAIEVLSKEIAKLKEKVK